ncbi:MAG: TlyA family RNA methyltransferase [Myxococcota bacterium]
MAGRPRKERLDVLLVERDLAPSRTRAQALILAGKVIVGDHRRDKPGEKVPADAPITVKGDDGWASRAAHKLLGALEAFPWLEERIRGARCLDVGASTGGFTDVLLRHGAAEVIAVDVGYGQLAWRLRSDERVRVMDRTNVRHLKPEDLPWAPDVVTCDASFISVRLFLDVIHRLMAPGGVFVVLVKPQFEVGRERVGKKGVVRDEEARRDALRSVREAAAAAGFAERGAADSPLAGPRGNVEMLLALEKKCG